jgi:RNA polymerase sigma-70 factor (ECF subfamily)
MRVGSDAAALVGWTRTDGTGMRRAEPQSGTADPSLDGADDRALVDAFRSGRRDAFDAIVRRHQRRVYQLCYRFAGNHEDAADLAQDVFVRAFKGLRKFKGDSALSTWLYRVGVNVCLSRASARRPATEPLDEVQPIDERGESSFDRVARGERAEALRRAIATLPPRQRATVMLRIYEDLPHEQIAQILGSSVGAVKANFFHAIGNLRRVLGAS